MELSIWHILILAIVLAAYLVPISNVLGRAGWNRWLVLLWLFPGINIVMLWMFAFGEWPTLSDRSIRKPAAN